jgi:hypothetical protein
VCKRITKAEKEVIDRALSLHLGKEPPEIRIYVRVNKSFGSVVKLATHPHRIVAPSDNSLSFVQGDFASLKRGSGVKPLFTARPCSECRGNFLGRRETAGELFEVGIRSYHRAQQVVVMNWPQCFLSQKLCDQLFFFFQLVFARFNFPTAEFIQRYLLNYLPCLI